MKIRINSGVATGYFKYSCSNIRDSSVTIYDIINIFCYGYKMETYLYYDAENCMYCICATGSITTLMSLRTKLRYLYDLIDLSES